jgi:hypothetical protein
LSAPTKGREFEFIAAATDDAPDHMRRLLDAVETVLGAGVPDVVVFRLLDYSGVRRAESTTRAHALAEAIVLAISRRRIVNVFALPPVLLAQRTKRDKATLDGDAETIAGRKLRDAAAAAMAGLAIAGDL